MLGQGGRRLLTVRASASVRSVVGATGTIPLGHDDDDEEAAPAHRRSQVRWFGRRDGNKAFLAARPMSRKKARKVRRRTAESWWRQRGRHGAPNSTASERRRWIEEQYGSALARAKELRGGPPVFPELDDDEHEYDEGDALLDEILSDSGGLISEPTPRPRNLGDSYERRRAVVKEVCDRWHREGGGSDGGEDSGRPAPPPPTDRQLASLVRAHRDRFGSRTSPVGVAAPLRELLEDLRVPSFCLGGRTRAALIGCAAAPAEADRVAAWALRSGSFPSERERAARVHVHARRGDFRGARARLDAAGGPDGSPPPLAAYTSTLAACHRVVSRGDAPRALKAEAFEVGWETWKEARIRGVEADVMAYGAVVRLCAAKGLPEKCLSLLDEAEAFSVRPTTLLFTACLRAVAVSHRIAARFQGGRSRRRNRRGRVAAYHGRLAREIVARAEQKEVDLDDGFVAALIDCAAAAGDAATAKAVALAAGVRRIAASGDVLAALRRERENEREHGRDARVPAALLGAHAEACRAGGLGDLWAGRVDVRGAPPHLARHNRGYLCERSLRAVEARDVPNYRRNDIPDMTAMEAGLASMGHEDLDELEDRRSDHKGLAIDSRFRGLEQNDDVGSTLDDLPDTIAKMYDGVPDPEDVDPEGYNFELLDDKAKKLTRRALRRAVALESGADDDDDDDAYDEEKDLSTKLYDVRVFRDEVRALLDDSDRDLDTFARNVREAHDDDEPLDAEGVADLFASLREEERASDALLDADDVAADVVNDAHRRLTRTGSLLSDATTPEERAWETLTAGEEEHDDSSSSSSDEDDEDDELRRRTTRRDDPTTRQLQPRFQDSNDDPLSLVPSSELAPISSAPPVVVGQDDDETPDALDLFLEGMPRDRVDKVRRAIDARLGPPPLLRLVPLLRETMPPVLTNQWLRWRNLRDADHVLARAEEERRANRHVLRAAVRVRAAGADVEEALRFHREGPRRYGFAPDQHDDRVMLGVLLRCRGVDAATAFKREVEADGRVLNPLSYGKLIRHHAARDALEPALELLREAIETHGYPPGEHDLRRLRLICRQRNLEDEVGLEDMIGPDPRAWIRRGEGRLKRESSKKGNRHVKFAKNLQTRI